MSSKIREKFIDHMELHGLSKETQRSYINGVKGLVKHYYQSPEKLNDDQVRAYFHHLITERKLAWTSCKSYQSGIIYFYRHICNREVDDRYGLPPRPRGRKLPVVLSMEEVAHLLSCVASFKHRVMLKTIYSAGLRIGEAVCLKPEHIESDPSRMVIRVEQGKGRKDRYTVLSEKLLLELREYWQKYSPQKWLFAGQKPDSHITTTSVWSAFSAARKKAGITKECSPHTLRHCFASHLLYKGYDLYTISQLLGHSSIKTTTIYLHITPARYVDLKSPLDFIELQKEGQNDDKE